MPVPRVRGSVPEGTGRSIRTDDGTARSTGITRPELWRDELAGSLAALAPLLWLGPSRQGRQIAWIRPSSAATLIGFDDRSAQGTWWGAQLLCSPLAAVLLPLLAAVAWILPGRRQRRAAAALTAFTLLPVLPPQWPGPCWPAPRSPGCGGGRSRPWRWWPPPWRG
ncbi:hypothetical protein ACTVZO_43425 [Streptomyces sp. IBSNAI002]|uniref:hypothetical protein n=1 Tax=Streptomyces sp. IBSNAI002 TaxID=3457500 RepID=UPI003FD399B6